MKKTGRYHNDYSPRYTEAFDIYEKAKNHVKAQKKKEKERTKTGYQMNITKAQFKQNKARAILEESYDGKLSHFIAALTGDDAITDVDEQELLSQIKAIKSDS